jgi:hypothetical protein
MKRYARKVVIEAARSVDTASLRSVDLGAYQVSGPVSFGPYTEFGPAQERAMKAARDGVRAIRIDRTSEGWMVTGTISQMAAGV